MKRATLLLACAHALTAPPQLSELKSNLKLKLRKQQLLRATASQNVTTPRRYASRAELKDTLVDIAVAVIVDFVTYLVGVRVGAWVGVVAVQRVVGEATRGFAGLN